MNTVAHRSHRVAATVIGWIVGAVVLIVGGPLCIIIGAVEWAGERINRKAE